MRAIMRKRRKELGMTHEDVAVAANIARTTYTNIELGTKNPSFDVALRIKKVLKTENDNIFLINNVPIRNESKPA